MQKMIKWLIPALLVLILQAAHSQDNIVEEYPEVFLRASREQKRVIVVFCHANCGWCRLLDKYLACPDVKEILERD